MIVSGTPEEWRGTLDQSTLALLSEMEANGLDYEAIISEWLEDKGSSNISRYSTGPGSLNYAKQFFEELRLFLCTEDEKYKGLRDELKQNSSKITAVYSSTIAGVIAINMGLTAALLTPVITIFFASLASVGINAWCVTRSSAGK